MSWSIRSTYALLTSIVLLNAVLWLDSLDRYISTRYHFELQANLPEEAFYPSRTLLAWTGKGENGEEPAVGDDNPVAGEAGEGEGAEHRVAAGGEATDSPKDTAKDQAKDSPEAGGVAAAKDDGAGAKRGGIVLAKADPDGGKPAIVKGLQGAAEVEAGKGGEAGIPTGEGPRILFAGDSMMQGVAPIVISKATKLYPKGYFSDLSKPSTGLTVKRYFDWPTKIKDEIGQRHFDTVVIFLGPNDPWDIMEGGKRYIFPSEEWVQKYRARVVEVLEYSKSKGVHVIWIGLPNMRNDRIRKGAIVENQVFHEETARYGYDYLSTEEILGSLDEPFSRHINHPSKGKVAVRAEDGIHFTPEGLRLIGARVFELIAARRNG